MQKLSDLQPAPQMGDWFLTLKLGGSSQEIISRNNNRIVVMIQEDGSVLQDTFQKCSQKDYYDPWKVTAAQAQAHLKRVILELKTKIKNDDAVLLEGMKKFYKIHFKEDIVGKMYRVYCCHLFQVMSNRLFLAIEKSMDIHIFI